MATAFRQTDQGLPNEDQGTVILGATLTVTIAALITVVTRLYVRIQMIHNVGWDDLVMVSAMVLVCHYNFHIHWPDSPRDRQAMECFLPFQRTKLIPDVN